MGDSFRIILFDFEGTLVNFQWNLKGAVREARKELIDLGFDLSAWEDHYAALRNNAILAASGMQIDQHLVAACIDKIYDRYDLDAASRWSLMPKAKAVISYLRNEKKVKLGLVSNIGRKALQEASARLGLTGLFDVVITRNDVLLLKPSGEGIKTAIGKLKGRESSTLFVGDSVSDVLAASDAGVKAAIVLGGESKRSTLLAAGPTFLWHSLEELGQADL